MKYLLLILGIALVLVGGYSIYSGYGIIEIERGWASVISGATALTGGVIVIALAWIVRSLDRLRAAIEAREMQIAQRGTQLSREPAEPPDLAVAAATLSIRENAAAQMREEPVFGADIAEIATWDSDPPAAPPAPQAAPPTTPRAPEPAARVPPLPPRAASAFASAAAKARIEPLGEPSINELWRRVGVNLDTAKSGTPADAPEAAAPSRQRPSADSATENTDWLDQALARFDAAVPPESADMNDEAPPLAPHASPEQPLGPQPEVIGRYEADGTAYVMYSDGSIDAQSEEGILRFKSMAELKAFFQS
jgi:hypothetical protein